MEFLLMTVVLYALCVHQGLHGTASNENRTDTYRSDKLVEKQSLEGSLRTPRLENCSGTLLALHHGSWVALNLTQQSDDTKKVMTQLCNDFGCGEIFDENATSINTCQSNCTIINSSLYNCAKAASENCSSVIEVVCEWQAVQLIGGKDRCAGRVELFGTGGWGTVCDDGWDLNGGNVVCAQLGCGTALRVMGENGDFIPGSGPIHISQINCTGTEENLWKCNGLKRDRNYCGHKEDAAVVCSGSSFKPFTTIKTFTPDLTNWTTEIVTEAAAEDKSGGISAPVLGCIVLSVTLFLLLFSNAAQCAYYKRRKGRIEIRVTSQASQQNNSDTSINSDYERYHDPDSPPPATANNCEHAPALDSGSTSSGECYGNAETENLLNPVVAQLRPEYCIQMAPLHNTSEAVKIVSADSFDSDSTSSGECYENTGPCLSTMEGDLSLPDQPSLGYPKPQMEGNSIVSQPYHPDQAPVLHSETVAADSFDSDSTSSGECYENTGPCLSTMGGDLSLPEQPSLGYPKPQMEGNSIVSQPYHPDQAPVVHSESAAADSFDSGSSSSEDCYENIESDVEPSLQTVEVDPSFPEQHPLSHTKPQTPGNSSVPHTHIPDQDDSSTSSEDAYENVAEIEDNCFAGSERSVHSASDSDYDDVCNW